MKVKDLKRVTNMNVNLMFYERTTNELINERNMNGYDHRDFINREIYMIYPTEEINTLSVALYQKGDIIMFEILNAKNLYHVYVERETKDDFITLYNEIIYTDESIDEIKNRFSRFNGSNAHIEISRMRIDELPFYSDKL